MPFCPLISIREFRWGGPPTAGQAPGLAGSPRGAPSTARRGGGDSRPLERSQYGSLTLKSEEADLCSRRTQRSPVDARESSSAPASLPAQRWTGWSACMYSVKTDSDYPMRAMRLPLSRAPHPARTQRVGPCLQNVGRSGGDHISGLRAASRTLPISGRYRRHAYRDGPRLGNGAPLFWREFRNLVFSKHHHAGYVEMPKWLHAAYFVESVSRFSAILQAECRFSAPRGPALPGENILPPY